jgi:parvulin-like peptidyl-prolyl isomerase
MTRSGRWALVLLVVVGLIVAGCGPLGGGSAATVNGKPVSMADYERQVKIVSDSMLANGVDPKTADGKATLDGMRGDILNQLIEMELVRQQAKAEGISVSDAEIQQRLAEIKQEVGGEAGYAEGLKNAGLTDKEFRTQMLPDQMLYEKLFEKVVAALPTTAEQVQARHIMIATEKEADAVLARLAKNEDFAAIAKELSLDTGSKDSGGDLGFAPRGVFDTSFEDAIFAAKVSAVSKVKSEYGWHVIQVLAHEDNKALAPEFAQSFSNEAMIRYMNDVYSKATVKISVKLPATPTPVP